MKTNLTDVSDYDYEECVKYHHKYSIMVDLFERTMEIRDNQIM